MAEASYDLQKAIRARLVASSGVTALVPVNSILDRNANPVISPSIIIGEGQTVGRGDIARRHHDTYTDLHIWITEPGLAQSKLVASAIRTALADGQWSFDSFQVADLHITSSRFMRDPDGLKSHGVISLAAVVVEVA